jgi:hypothetical protein
VLSYCFVFGKLVGRAGFEPAAMGALSYSESSPYRARQLQTDVKRADHIVINVNQTRPFSDRRNDWIQGVNGAFVSSTGGDIAAVARRTK